MEQETWVKLSRHQQVDWLIEHNDNSIGLSLNDIREWCERHAFEDKVRDPIFNKSLNYPVSITERWVLFMMTLGFQHKYKDLPYCHYRRDVINVVRAAFNKEKYDLTGYGLLSREPFNFIESLDKGQLAVDSQGMWRLTTRGRDFLSGKIKVPQKVLFSVVGNNYKIVGDDIAIEQVPRFNFGKAIKILKSYS